MQVVQWPHTFNTETYMSDLTYAPPAFKGSEGKAVVFVDFLSANYTIVFDPVAKSANVRSDIVFQSEHGGWPAFELNIRPHKIKTQLDGIEVTCDSDWAPGAKAPLLVLKSKLSRGLHLLTVRHRLEDVETKPSPLHWDGRSVGCIFHMSDILEEEPTNRFLGSYLPSNFEFDHFKISMHVKVRGSSVDHVLISNTGVVPKSARNVWKFEYPAHFTTSFPWFHLIPLGPYKFADGLYRSKQGRQFPIYVYGEESSFGDMLPEFLDKAKLYVTDLERRFGPFPYPAITILTMPAGWGGMEHAGATATDIDSIRHELDHSYFARCVAPANGSAGWIDEAIASWGDHGYPSILDEPEPAPSGLTFESPYAAVTKSTAYAKGREFLAYLDSRAVKLGGLQKFLRIYFERKRYQSISVNEFKLMLEGFFGQALDKEFDKHVYGRDGNGVSMFGDTTGGGPTTDNLLGCPHRRIWSAKQLRQQLFPY